MKSRSCSKAVKAETAAQIEAFGHGGSLSLVETRTANADIAQ
jgi:hypothetical protein